MSKTALLEITGVKKYFPVKKASWFAKPDMLHAVDDVSLWVERGETLGIVGESGCGKSSLAKTIAQLYEATDGDLFFNGQNLGSLTQKQTRKLRPKIQYVFQDPYESLNPRHTIGFILEEPFVIHTELSAEQRKDKVKALLAKVGLPESSIEKYPHEFSGGQRQRIGIARAIALEPELLICDEPVSALDVSVQSQILNLLMELQQELNLAILFIAHDLAVVKHISDRIAVMYLGQIIEQANTDQLFASPQHPYTQFLLDAIPTPNPASKRSKRRIQGELPSPINPPKGCRFQSRCPLKDEQCANSIPLIKVEDNSEHEVACHHSVESAKSWTSPWPNIINQSK